MLYLECRELKLVLLHCFSKLTTRFDSVMALSVGIRPITL